VRWSMCRRSMNSPSGMLATGESVASNATLLPIQRVDEDALTRASLPQPVSMAVTGGSRRCCGRQAGNWGKIECSASGVAKLAEGLRAMFRTDRA